MRVTPGVSMQIALRAIAAGLVVGLLGSCTLLIDDQLPPPDCDAARFEPPPQLSCEAAVQAAADSLAASSKITAVSFQYGSLCPPNARCLAAMGNAGTVIVTFADASQVFVFVHIDAGQLVVDEAKAYPPPGWDL